MLPLGVIFELNIHSHYIIIGHVNRSFYLHQNAFVAGAMPRTSLGELIALQIPKLVFRWRLHGRGGEMREWKGSFPLLLFYNLTTEDDVVCR